MQFSKYLYNCVCKLKHFLNALAFDLAKKLRDSKSERMRALLLPCVLESLLEKSDDIVRVDEGRLFFATSGRTQMKDGMAMFYLKFFIIVKTISIVLSEKPRE